MTVGGVAVLLFVAAAAAVGVGAAVGRSVRRFDGWVHLLVGWFLGMVVLTCGVMVAMAALGHIPRAAMDLLVVALPGSVAAQLAVVGMAWASGRGLALTHPGWRWLAAAWPALGLVVGSWYGWDALAKALGIAIVEQPIVVLIRSAPWESPLGGLRLYGALGAPILEEAIFRGWLQGILAEKLGGWRALLLVAVAFTLLHADTPTALPPIFVLSFAVGWLRRRSGSIVPGLIVHLCNNTLSLLLG